MKFQYMHETITGDAEFLVKRLNELGDEGWEIVHVRSITTESSILNPSAMIILKRENSGRKKKSDE